MRIGVISDTHGLLRPEAVEALAGCDLIIHAGDVGAERILSDLAGVAPLVAVRGNVDKAVWADRLPFSVLHEVAGFRLRVLHRSEDLGPDEQNADAIIFGHSHKPSIEWRDGRLFLNPGSAGPRRFRLPVTVARIEISRKRLVPMLIELAV